MGADSLEEWLGIRPMRQASVSKSKRFTLGALVDEWRVEEFLGSGLSADVYCVVNARTGLKGALKLFQDGEQPGLRERFLAEMDAIRELKLRDLPSFYGSGKYDGSPYYVMEYLQPLLFPIPRREVPCFMVAVAKAVQRLHSAGYVHRDLKPANILLRRNGNGNGKPVLIDLGLVKRMEDVAKGACPSALSFVNGRPVRVGTDDYSAPEQLIKGEATARSDVFSLGKVLDACFEDRPTGVWLDIVRRATQVSPDDRYPTADDFARAIRRRNLPRIFMCSGALALACLLVAVVMIRPAPPPPPSPPESPVETPPVDFGPEFLCALPNETEEERVGRILPMAEKGNVDAQLIVAEAFFHGRGVATNREEAVVWYKRAAESGSHDAEASLGLCALRGWGCPKSYDAAVDWFIRAAEARNLSAISNLAFCYMNGFGVERDEAEAFNLARDAAARGHAPAQVFLAECYMDGRGTKKNLACAETWLQAAARQGNKRAKMLLDCL